MLEIVSTPTMSAPHEAGAYLESLRRIVRAIGVSDGDLSRGSLRCDANVSVRRPGEPLGTKTEVFVRRCLANRFNPSTSFRSLPEIFSTREPVISTSCLPGGALFSADSVLPLSSGGTFEPFLLLTWSKKSDPLWRATGPTTSASGTTCSWQADRDSGISCPASAGRTCTRGSPFRWHAGRNS